MKANELRIGNIFRDKYTRMMIIVIGLTDNEITFSGEFDGEWQAEPIPLTEECLLRFGFEKDDKFGNWHLDHLEIYKKDLSIIGIDDKGNIYWYFYAADDYYSWTQKLDYVHQLQNLYFALTGKELTI